MMLNKKDFTDFGSGALVAICGGLAGHYAALGMGPVQWAGAACAVLGSVTLAVAVRIWPAEARSRRQED
jgi:predicted amino acid dehydrogenase